MAQSEYCFYQRNTRLIASRMDRSPPSKATPIEDYPIRHRRFKLNLTVTDLEPFDPKNRYQ
jgi:hypothetical protein